MTRPAVAGKRSNEELEAAVRKTVADSTERNDFSGWASTWPGRRIKVHVEGDGPMAGTTDAADGSRQFHFPDFKEMSNGTLKYDVRKVFMDDTQTFVVTLSRLTAVRDGVALNEPLCCVWRIGEHPEDQEIIENWDHFYDIVSWDAFWDADFDRVRVKPEGPGIDEDAFRAAARELRETQRDDVWAPFLADDVVAFYDGSNPGAGKYVGKDAVLRSLGWYRQRSGGTLETSIEKVMTDNFFAISVGRWQAQRDGRSLDHLVFTAWWTEQGKAIRSWTHIDDLTTWDEFWND